MGVSAMASSANAWRWLWISIVIVCLDQWTKWLIVSQFELYEVRPITDWFNLVLVHNKGAAFSFLSSAGGWQRWFFIVLTLAVAVGLLIWLFRLSANLRRLCIGITLILGGAIANLIDRVRFGYVIDFLDVYVKGWHWPAFNVADAAICCGVGLLLLDSFFDAKKNRV